MSLTSEEYMTSWRLEQVVLPPNLGLTKTHELEDWISWLLELSTAAVDSSMEEVPRPLVVLEVLQLLLVEPEVL